MRLRILTPGATTNKVIATIAVLGAAAAIAGLGTFATFTSSTSTSHTIASGTLSLTSGPVNRLGTGASLIAAGDSMQRAIDLNYAGSVDMGSATLTTSASTSSALDTDTTDGLRLAIDKCSVAWTESGPPYTYTCGGSVSTVLASQPLIGSNVGLSNLTLTAGTTDHLRVTVTLPSTAGNAFQNLSSTVGYTFTGVQRAGTSQ
jgi:predicted ribosomally synthesized peptide with SipW-like signal peptide